MPLCTTFVIALPLAGLHPRVRGGVCVDARRGTRTTTRATAAAPPQSPANTFDFDSFARLLYDTQSRLCGELEAIDASGESFCTHPWEGKNGGGTTRVLQNGHVFEKAGVNVSVVHGTLSDARARAMASRGRVIPSGTAYRAAALSLVCHARSPHLPTLRADARVFAAGDRVWAGGGADLTPFYVHRASAAFFHAYWRGVLEPFDRSFYPAFKNACDDYFYIPSRAERRGLGGIFYDDIELDAPRLVELQAAVLDGLLPSYEPALRYAAARPYSEAQKRWQRVRRARYLEFNLLFDRGVKFGLAGAPPERTDAIMISAPPQVDWPYAEEAQAGTPEAELVEILSGPPIDWAAEFDAVHSASN